MRQVFKAVAGGLIVTALSALIPILLIETLGLANDSAIVLLLPVIWPLPIFNQAFPHAHPGLILEFQRGAVRAALASDVLLYSALTYCVLRWRERRLRFR